MSRRASFGFGLFLFFLWSSCAHQVDKPDLYVAEFATTPPTTVLVNRVDSDWVVINGAERITLRQIRPDLYRVPVFGGSWKGGWESESWVGFWTDSLRPDGYRVPVVLRPVSNVPTSTAKTDSQTSTWSTNFGPLLMRVFGDSVWATVATSTGDFRHLAGTVENKRLNISTFDGSHLFHFEADIDGDTLRDGLFISGTHYRSTFSGVKTGAVEWESGVQQPVQDDVVFQGVAIESGDTVQWDASFLKERGRVGLVMDIMGSWCPNCMDEARLLRELAPENPDIQFVSLAFERNSGEGALKRLRSFQADMDIDWPILLGGPASKSAAANALAFVDTVHSFPTTVFWKPGGSPVVHRGFNGPATGDGYAREKEFFLNQLRWLNGRSESH